MWNKIKAMFAPPGATAIAARELEEARRQLLAAQSGREYAEAMCQYHSAKIERLANYLRREPE